MITVHPWADTFPGPGALKRDGGKLAVDLGSPVKTLPECQFRRKYVRSWKILEIGIV